MNRVLTPTDLQTIIQILALVSLFAGGGMAYQRLLSKMDLWGERFISHRDAVLSDLKALELEVEKLRTRIETLERNK